MGILSVWIIAFAISIRYRLKIEEVAVIGVSLVSFVLLLTGNMGSLEIGIFVASGITIACLLYVLYQLVRSPKAVIGTALSIGSISLIAYTIFFVVNYKGCGIYHADNLTYWGINLKYLYNTSALRTVARNFRTIHPEGILVWDYFILKTWVGYTESLPLAFHGLICVALAMPLLRYARGQYKYLKAIVLWIFILALPVAAYDGYSSLYGDVPLALSFAMCVVSLVDYVKSNSHIQILRMVSLLYLVLSTKRGGIIVASCFMLLAAFLLWRNKNVKKESRIVLTLLFVETIMVNVLWLARIDFVNVATVVVTTVIGVLLALVHDNYDKFTKLDEVLAVFIIGVIIGMYGFIKYFLIKDTLSTRTIANFFAYFLTCDICFLGLSLAMVLAFFIVVLFVYKYKYIKGEGNLTVLEGGVGLVLSSLLFLCIYMILYVKSIGPSNGDLGPYMPSFQRYMAPIVYSIIVYTIYLILDEFADGFKYTIFLLGLSAVLFVSPLCQHIFIKVEPVEFYGFDKAGIEITEDDNILIVLSEAKSDSGIEWSGSFAYAMSPATCIDIFSLINIDPDDEPIEEWPVIEYFICEVEKQDIDYIYFQHLTDDFYELYGDLFPGLADFHSGMVYKVNYSSDGITFELM